MALDFGTRFMPKMMVSKFDDGWSQPSLQSSSELTISPAAHVLHYASTCFEGLKAFKHEDESIQIFRLDQNVKRFSQSSQLLYLPPIDTTLVTQMIIDTVGYFRSDVPLPPASMYIRPTHLGTEPSIGKAAAPSDTSILFVLLSPVGDYFTGGEATLRLLIDDVGMRCGNDHGMVKGGGNYASALKHIVRAKQSCQADQVLFCPNGDVQETGAANFLLIDGNEIITKALDESFLHGVTRNSILALARDKGMNVSERDISVEELLERAAKADCEAGLSGTAAVVASVGTFIYQGKEYKVGNGKPGPRIRELREELNAIQWGKAEDKHQWLTAVTN